MAYTLTFPRQNVAPALIPGENPPLVVEPNGVEMAAGPPDVLISQCLQNPIGMSRLREELTGREKVLILVDDYTRLTPAHEILPLLIGEILAAGVPKKRIELLVASGTHRAMTAREKQTKCGPFAAHSFRIHDHLWSDESRLDSLGKTANGTDILINSLLSRADFIIGIGHIVPHRVAGYSGGAKIVQPGVCGALTTGQTHWLSAKHFRGRDIMGRVRNPVRDEINQVGKKAGLQFIFNTVQAGDGSLYKCVCGEPIDAFEAGCEASREVYGCPIDRLADIVIADSYPAHVNMWQSSKGIYGADLALKDDGILILVSSCPEGIAREHPEVGEFGYADPQGIEAMVERGELEDLTVAAHILHVGRVISRPRQAFLVSPGISRAETERLGFLWSPTVQEALNAALERKGPGASITFLKHGGEVMPVYEPGKEE